MIQIYLLMSTSLNEKLSDFTLQSQHAEKRLSLPLEWNHSFICQKSNNKEIIQKYATLLCHISNLNKYSAPSQCFGSEFSSASPLSAQHMWIWGFALMLPRRFGRAQSSCVRSIFLKAILNSFCRFSVGFEPELRQRPHKSWATCFSAHSSADCSVPRAFLQQKLVQREVFSS